MEITDDYFTSKYGDPGNNATTQVTDPSIDPGDDYFSKKYGAPTAPQEVLSQDANSNSFLDGVKAFAQTAIDGVESFNRSIAKPVEATLKGAYGYIDPVFGTHGGDKVAGVNIANNASLAEAQARSPMATTIGGFAGDVARTVPAAILTGGASIPGQMIAGAAINSVANGADAVADSKPVMPAIGYGAVTGAAGGLISGAVGKLISIGTKDGTGILNKIFTPTKAAERSIYNEALQARGGAQGALSAGDDAAAIGINLSPSQQIGEKSAENKISSIVPQNVQGKLAISNGLRTEEDKVSGQLKGIVDNMNVDEAGKKISTQIKNEAFDALKPIGLKTEDASNLGLTTGEISPTLSKYIKSPADLNSVHGLYEVKKLMNDDLYSYGNGLGAAAKQDIREARAQVVAALENSGGEAYKTANTMAQKLILKNDVDEALSKTGRSGTLKDLYTTLFQSKGADNKISDFLEKVKDAGGDVGYTKKVINVMGQMQDQSAHKVADRGVGKSVGNVGGGITGAVQRFIDNVAEGMYNKEMTKLIIPGSKWAPAVKELLAKDNNPETFNRGLSSLLERVRKGQAQIGRAGLLGLGQSVSNSLTK